VISKEAFNISGVSDIEIKGKTVNFIFKGNINSVMKRIAEIDIRNISIEEPDLEEIFMHYYAKEE
jgi:ABC-2 type transport system ATP-binding protein